MKTFLVFVIAMIFANAHAGSTEKNQFFQEIYSISPNLARALALVGKSYENRCGSEPTIEQYKRLANESEAYGFLVGLHAREWPVGSEFPEEIPTIYEKLTSKQKCFVIDLAS